MSRCRVLLATAVVIIGITFRNDVETWAQDQHDHARQDIEFTIRSIADGAWSEPATWEPARVPHAGDRVLVSRGTFVDYDVQSPDVIRMVQVVGTLSFSRERDTELNVGLLKVQNSMHCSESGFACDFHSTNAAGEPHAAPDGPRPALLIGTPEAPIPAEHTAVIRLHYLDGMPRNDAPAIACCSARMEIHGSPLSHTWLKLGADVAAGENVLTLSEPVTGWRVGDEVIVTATARDENSGTFRVGSSRQRPAQTEQRRIAAIDGRHITLDAPLEHAHSGSGEFRGEVANLSRNVVIESADPDGVRGHTVFHRFSSGGISYARFAHLGKEGVLGRYSIHFHLVGDTMRGSSVRGVAIVDSHNRWITIHGTQYLVVRDCVGYQSVGHGFFLEDGTEVYNLLDHNLAVQACRGKRLPDQVLPFDPNDGAGFWWANGRNTITHNVTCENDEYGYRYDMQRRSNFDPRLLILQPDGTERVTDVRTIPIWRFEQNEAHSEGFYGMVVAANGDQQPDTPIRDDESLRRIENVDWTGPDVEHPHVVRNLSIWQSHYAFRPHSPAMLMENVAIRDAAYGIYRPALENQVYRNLSIANVDAEPFNRGMDDASAQTGSITVDGLTFFSGYGNRSTPLVQISDDNLSGDAATHFRNVVVHRQAGFEDRWPLINRGVGPRPAPVTEHGVPIYIHDYFGPGRHAKVVSTASPGLSAEGLGYHPDPPLTGDESVVAEVTDVPWPELLHPVDDLPPATIITSVRIENGKVHLAGVTHDNGNVKRVVVNDKPATIISADAGVVDWKATRPLPPDGQLTAYATDDSGNVEQQPHRLTLLDIRPLASR